MDIDFPIHKIEFKFKIVGDCKVTCIFNGNEIDVNGPIVLEDIHEHNTLVIEFNKFPTDDSFATLDYFRINNLSDHLDWFKKHAFSIDRSRHPETVDMTIPNNAYFGYNGSMQIDIANKHDQLTNCLLYTSPSPRDRTRSRMPSSA